VAWIRKKDKKCVADLHKKNSSPTGKLSYSATFLNPIYCHLFHLLTGYGRMKLIENRFRVNK